MDVALRPVAPAEYDDFFLMFEDYERELDAYDPSAAPYDVDRYRTAVLDDMKGRELLWILAGGRRAGLAVVRTLDDWPDDTRQVASIAAFYVAPDHRRRGVGRAAVEAILAEHRARGTWMVEADILRDNEPAKAFWASLGFEVQVYQTGRRP